LILGVTGCYGRWMLVPILLPQAAIRRTGCWKKKFMVRIGSVECGSGRLGLERFGRRRGDLAPGFQVHSVGGEFSRDVVTKRILARVYADFIVVTEVVTGYV